jgi:hypothetical protein
LTNIQQEVAPQLSEQGDKMNNEQVMKIMEELGLHEGGIENWITDNGWVKVAEKVASAEREACIKLLEDFSKTTMVPVVDTWRMGLIAGAHAIRARGQS